jgi:Xaa-Pro aminopeptidase
VLFTDPRYGLQASEQTACQVRVARGPLVAAAARWLRGKGVRRFGFEKAHLSYESFLSLDGRIPLGVRMIPTAGLVEDLRMVKSPQEIDLIRRSVLLNSEAFERAIRRVRPGMSEMDLASELEYQMRRLGAEKPAFETIVASGARSAMPHAGPTSKLLARNELLLVDMGAVRDGYSSDMTRMAFLGRPGPKIRQLYRAVLEAQEAARAAVREGVTAEQVDRAARSVLKAHGLDRAFLHSCGHGLGLEVHESPRLGRGDRTRLKAGMAVTLEPGVYLQEFGGIRIEDTVVVARSGCEVLTPTPRKLLAL